MSKDYYKTLEVEKGANADEIKKGFRKLAHQYHPDKPTGDEAKFKEINEAYQVLSDDKKRQQYDQFGSAAFNGAGGAGGMNWQDFARQSGGAQGFDVGDIDLGDIFGQAFGFGGRGRKKSGPQRGQDIQTQLKITFDEAIHGAKKNVTLHRTEKCIHCSGNGAEPGTAINTCSDCNGSGSIASAQRTPFGTFQTKTKCRTCRGEGSSFERVCVECNGVGLKDVETQVEVTIPAGIDHGETMRMSGEGMSGIKGGPTGDLYMQILVEPSQQYAREGYDILSKSVISYPTAILGGKIKVDTIDGVVDLKIPAGSASGTTLRMKNKGIQKLRGRGRGDHLVEVEIATPKSVSRKAKKLLEELEREL